MPSESQPVSKSHYDYSLSILSTLSQSRPRTRAACPKVPEFSPDTPRGDWHVLLGYYRNYLVLDLNNRPKNLWQLAISPIVPRHKKKLFTQLDHYIL